MALVGTAHCLSGRPAFTQTNAFLSVPLPFTTTSWLFTGAPACAASHLGWADISRLAIFGAVPSNATLPVTVPPLASSGVAEPPAAGAEPSGAFAVSEGLSPPPQLINVREPARMAPIQIFFIAL